MLRMADLSRETLLARSSIDGLDAPGLYFGTSTGQVFASADEGDTWLQIASYLPGVASVEVAVVD